MTSVKMCISTILAPHLQTYTEEDGDYSLGWWGCMDGVYIGIAYTPTEFSRKRLKYTRSAQHEQTPIFITKKIIQLWVHPEKK